MAFSIPPGLVNNVSPCNHEKADTRLFLHVKDVSLAGHTCALVRVNDTDVEILAYELFPHLVGLECLWLHFGTAHNPKFIAVHEVYHSLGPIITSALPAFHALSGCDQVSPLNGFGKKSY